MAGRSSRRNNNNDDPYWNQPADTNHEPGYEYVGTDEATQRGSPPPRYQSRGSSPQRRSRHGHRDPSPQQRDRDRPTGSSPTRRQSTKGKVPPPPTDAELNAMKKDKFNNWGAYQAKYNDWAQRPEIQAHMERGKSYGKKGINFMSSAAAAYMASQGLGGGGGQSPRSRSVDREYHSSGKDRGGGSGRYHQPERDDDRRQRRRDPSYSPSPPRRRGDRHDARSKNRRNDSESSSPPRRRNGHDDRNDRDRDGRHGHRDDDGRQRRSRNHSYSRSPSPHSSSRHKDRDSRGRPLGRSNTTGGDGGFRRSFSENMKPPPDRNATARWQMAARAALQAGGVAAYRVRKEPGGWAGPKGAKVATAALGAAAMDAFVDKDPRREKGNGMKGMAENVIGGLIASKMTGVKRAKSGRRR